MSRAQDLHNPGFDFNRHVLARGIGQDLVVHMDVGHALKRHCPRTLGRKREWVTTPFEPVVQIADYHVAVLLTSAHDAEKPVSRIRLWREYEIRAD